jgi:hypothetical protein
MNRPRPRRRVELLQRMSLVMAHRAISRASDNRKFIALLGAGVFADGLLTGLEVL